MIEAPFPDRLGELLHLGVVHVLAEMGADEHQAPGVADVGRLGRADGVAEGQLEPDVARAAALGKGRGGDVRRAVGLERVLEKVAAEAVTEHRHRLGAVLGLDLLHLLGDVAEGLVPRDLGPAFLAADAGSQQGRPDAVGVEVGADAARAPRAQPTLRERVVRVPLDLPERPIADRGDGVALPEADVAEGGNPADPLLQRALGGAKRPGSAAREEPAAAAPAPTPAIFRKRRRETSFMRHPAG